MQEIVIMPISEETRKALLKDYERLERCKTTTGHPFIREVCQHRQNLILEYLQMKELQKN